MSSMPGWKEMRRGSGVVNAMKDRRGIILNSDGSENRAAEDDGTNRPIEFTEAHLRDRKRGHTSI